ncbi:MAG: restriction endonuclease [Flavobacteriaceae bacterium]
MEKQIYINKSNGETELFSFEKLKRSLKSVGTNNNVIEAIIHDIQSNIYDGMSSNEIYKKAFALLKKHNKICASRYSLKRALFDLGPTGYPFERLIAALLREKGYKTQVSTILEGTCVTHEIDVLAEKDGNAYAIECKFHSDAKAASNVKVPLYINSRFLDIQQQWNTNSNKKTHLKQGWLVTNTRFTEDALNYGKCVGLTLLSWDYPKGNGIKTNIDSYGLYPVTALTTLTKNEKRQLITANIILIKELYYNIQVLQNLGISKNRLRQTKNEIGNLLHYNSFTNETR